MSEASPPTWKIWWKTLRPATLTAGVAPVLVGSALARADGMLDWGRAVVFLVGFVLLQVASNLINDAADFRMGADGADRLGPPRAAQQGWLGEQELTRAATLCLAIAGALTLHLARQGGWPVLVGGVLAVAGAISYTAGPVPMAYRGGGDVMVFFFFGLTAVCGSYYVQTGSIPAHGVIAAAIMGMLSTAILVVNNLRDRHSDARAGKRTLVARFGERFGRLEYALLVLGAYAVLAASGLVLGRASWALPLLSLPWALRLVRAVWRTDGAALNPLLGKTALLGFAFALLWVASLAPAFDSLLLHLRG